MEENTNEYLVSTYADMVYKLALSQMKNVHNAEDIFQEVFLQLIKRQKNFENKEHEKAYILRTTINCCKKHYRSAWLGHHADLEDTVMEEIFSDTDASDTERDLYYAILELPTKYRIVIHAFYYEEMSISMIAKALHTKEGTIKSQLSRARTLLKEILAGEY